MALIVSDVASCCFLPFFLTRCLFPSRVSGEESRSAVCAVCACTDRRCSATPVVTGGWRRSVCLSVWSICLSLGVELYVSPHRSFLSVNVVFMWFFFSKGDGPIVLILAPTRELVEQIRAQCRTFAAPSKIHHAAAYGGVPKRAQITELEKGAEICVACPGKRDISRSRLVIPSSASSFLVSFIGVFALRR